MAAGSEGVTSTVMVGVVNFLSTLISLFLLDRVGRRPLLLIGIAGMGLSLIHLGYLFRMTHLVRSAILIDVIVYLASFAIGLGPIFWLVISEIYPTTVRGQAMSLASVTIWLSDLVVTTTFLSLVEALGAGPSFWVYGAACVAGFIFSWQMVPETKGRTLEQIEASWQ